MSVLRRINVRVEEFVDEKEAEIGKRYIVDSDEAQEAWWAAVDELPASDLRNAVVEELTARGYISARPR